MPNVEHKNTTITTGPHAKHTMMKWRWVGEIHTNRKSMDEESIFAHMFFIKSKLYAMLSNWKQFSTFRCRVSYGRQLFGRINNVGGGRGGGALSICLCDSNGEQNIHFVFDQCVRETTHTRQPHQVQRDKGNFSIKIHRFAGLLWTCLKYSSGEMPMLDMFWFHQSHETFKTIWLWRNDRDGAIVAEHKKKNNKLNSSYGSDRSIGQFYSREIGGLSLRRYFHLVHLANASSFVSIWSERLSFHLRSAETYLAVQCCTEFLHSNRLNLITRSKPF